MMNPLAQMQGWVRGMYWHLVVYGGECEPPR